MDILDNAGTCEENTTNIMSLKVLTVYESRITLCILQLLRIIADSPVKLLEAGKFNKSNIMIGFTRDDGTVLASGVPGSAEPACIYD